MEANPAIKQFIVQFILFELFSMIIGLAAGIATIQQKVDFNPASFLFDNPDLLITSVVYYIIVNILLTPLIVGALIRANSQDQR